MKWTAYGSVVLPSCNCHTCNGIQFGVRDFETFFSAFLCCADLKFSCRGEVSLLCGFDTVSRNPAPLCRDDFRVVSDGTALTISISKSRMSDFSFPALCLSGLGELGSDKLLNHWLFVRRFLLFFTDDRIFSEIGTLPLSGSPSPVCSYR